MEDTLAAPATVGKKLGAYRIESLLGAGAMGEVFRGTHEALGRPVAIKMLKPDAAADQSLMQRFFAEARAVNIIRHENIVECTDLVNDPGGQSYIVMELLEGRTLGDAIRVAGRLPPKRAVSIAAQIADAIGAAHGKGIVHRDLKPDNVFLIRRAGSSDYVKVLDFGIARLRPDLGVAATQSGMLVGTPAYMAPEQARAEKVGPPADIYALGVILFHMLAGELPFKASSVAMMIVAQLQETPPRIDKIVPGVPSALADLVERALDKDAAKRPATMAELRTGLLQSVGLPVEPTASVMTPARALSVSVEETIPAVAVSSLSAAAGHKPVIAAPSRRRSVMWVALGGLVVAAGIGGVIASRGSVEPASDRIDKHIAAPPPTIAVDAAAIATPTPTIVVDAAAAIAPTPNVPEIDAGVAAAKPEPAKASVRAPPKRTVAKPTEPAKPPVDAGVPPVRDISGRQHVPPPLP